MALVSVSELLFKAEREGYAVGAFNANNMEIVQAIAQAAALEKIAGYHAGQSGGD